MRAIRGDHTPQAIATTSASKSPRLVRTRRDTAVLDVDPLDLGVGENLSPFRLCSLPHDRAEAQRVDDRHRGRVEAAEQDRFVDERDELLDLRRRDEPAALDAPRLGRGHPPPQLLQPLLGARDLDAPAFVQGPGLAVLAHRLERELRHLLGMVDREDEVRRVAGRAAGVRERPLVDLHEVGPAELGQPAGEAVADDPSADHDDLHTLTRTFRIACSKSWTWAPMISAAPSPLPTTMAWIRSRCASTASSRSSAWSSAIIQMRRART